MRKTWAAKAGAAVVLCGLTALSIAGCSSTPEESSGDLVKVRLAENNTVSSLSAVIAEKQGMFEKHGLDVEPQVMADITKIPPALGQQFDIGFGVPPVLIRGASQGLDVVVVSGGGVSTEELPEVLVASQPESGISKPEDLVGKKLAAPTLTGNLHLGAMYWLSKNGIESDEVEQLQVPSPNMIDQLDQGVIDAAELQQPYITLARQKGMTFLPYALSEIADPVRAAFWTANGEWASENEETIMNFRAALDEAYAWMQDNESEAKEILADFTQQDSELVEEAPLPIFTSDYSVEDLRVWDDVLTTTSDFDSTVDYEKLVAFPTGS